MNNSNRKLRVHRKSRQGCGNCKLRSVKCDESKPACRRCVAYGVSCNYDRTQSNLRAPMEKLTVMKPSADISYWANRTDHLLNQFQVQTASTVSTGKRLKIYQNEVVELARWHPFLRHAIQTLTLMHARHLWSDSPSELSTLESYHWYQAVSSFNARLSQGRCRGEEQAAALATAGLLGTLVFCHVEARTPEEAWPLSSESPSDLNWLRMNAGKQDVWNQLRSDEPHPASTVLATLYTEDRVLEPSDQFEFGFVPAELARVYELHTINPGRNPYSPLVMRLARVLYTECPVDQTLLSFVSFVSTMPPDFKTLLEQKEPRALLLLLLWYAKICNLGVWWLSRRALLEGKAICLYLQRHFLYDRDIQRLLGHPRSILYAANSPTLLTV
ncbi:hypothetical protein BDW59DRAFT_176595 [Aspergillus cavernicola]|uniref:Zn(2)-C6 fungal-type domain-containing protein n=1 Tax=Aspergillus cavernicola TaxID=176166 RepID=A0ABR4HEN1_9EURO